MRMHAFSSQLFLPFDFSIRVFSLFDTVRVFVGKGGWGGGKGVQNVSLATHVCLYVWSSHTAEYGSTG